VDDRFEATDIDGRKRAGLDAADRKRTHLCLGVGTTHRIGVDDRPLQDSRCHQGPHPIAATDFDAHQRRE